MIEDGTRSADEFASLIGSQYCAKSKRLAAELKRLAEKEAELA